ncbi:MAG: cob(I)yrinic acid a,c-diamide adenosyltransferase [Bdellovibrionales bacterium]|jgi:cob(I)alamin adenosyltransferase|nr:cob(I)yrinic acid a,c-diamide adenosyltransferase [Bdellovibrionales bacterium]
MVKVYTKTGDQGKTALVGGTRLLKSDSKIDLYGEVDELNSSIGMIRAYITSSKEKESLSSTEGQLTSLQSTLFSLGSYLACEPEKRTDFNILGISQKDILDLEIQIDNMVKELPELKKFILPAGELSAVQTHLARTICRRIERKMVLMNENDKGYLESNTLIFINRLSDYFFTTARYLNFKLGHEESEWVK